MATVKIVDIPIAGVCLAPLKLMRNQALVFNAGMKGSIFVFPPWIGFTVLFFTVLVTTLAAFYPARHAARVNPVTALRHE